MNRKVSVVTMILVLLSVAIGANAETDLTDPYEIYNKYLDAIGGLERLKAEKTSYSEGEIEIVGTGLKGTIKVWNMSPDKGRQEMDLTVLTQTSGNNGEVSWSVDANGKLQLQTDEASLKRRKISKLLAEFDFLNPESENFTLTFGGIDTVGETECYVVITANGINDDEIVNYFNTSTFMQEKSENRHPDDQEYIVYSDYRDVGGILLSHHQDMTHMPIGQNVVFQMTSYESNPEIDPAVFEPPEEDVKDYRFVNGVNAEDVAFSYIGKHIFIPVYVNGKEELWLLDSGAGMSVLDSAYAEELGIESEGRIKGSGAGNQLEFSFVKAPPFSLEGIEFDSQRMVSSGFLRPYTYRHFGFSSDGILGYDFLSRFVTRIDYANELISFYDPEQFSYEGSGTVVNAPIVGNTFTMPVTIDGKYTGTWSLDLGAGTCNFHYPYAEANGLLDREGVAGLGFGAGGSLPERTVKFESLELAGFTISDPTVDLTLEDVGGAFGRSEIDGNLGSTVFRHLVLYLDYERQQVIVEKGDNFGKDFPEDKSGMQLIMSPESKIEVVFVAPDTPASKAGLKEGDVILSINDTDSDALGGLLATRELFKKDPGTKYQISLLRDGQEKQITLELENLFD